MAEINWGILDPNTPGRVASSYQDAINAKEDRANQLAMRTMQMQGMQNQNKLAGFQMEDAELARSNRNALNRAYSDAYGPNGIDYDKAASGLAKGGQGSLVPSILKERDANQMEAIKREGETIKALKPIFTSVIANPTTEAALAALEEAQRLSGKSLHEKAKEILALNDDQEAIRRWFASRVMEADKLLPQIESMNLGGQQVQQRVDPLTKKVISEQSYTRTPEGYTVGADGTLKIDPGYQAGKTSIAKAGATTISVDAGAKQAIAARGKEFGKFAMEATQNAQNSADTASDINMIVDGLRGMGGGPVANFKAWAGQVLPPDSDWGRMSSMSNLAETVQAKLAPQARAAGSGATSDFEMKMYMRAIPTLASTEKGRELMAKYANRVAERSQVRAEIVNDIEQEGKLPTPALIASRMKARLPDKFFDDADKSFFGSGKAPAAKPSAAGKLSPAEQQELDALRKRFGK